MSQPLFLGLSPGDWIQLVGILAAIVYSAYQMRRNTIELRAQAEASLYSAAFEWDRMLIDSPDLRTVLLNPSAGPLTNLERSLAEYRLDLAEYVFTVQGRQLYRGESDHLARLLSIPLIRKALSTDELRASLKREFLRECQAHLPKTAEAK